MNFLRLIPVLLSSLLLGAHFLKAGLMPLAVIAIIFPVILFVRRPWSARLVQIILVASAGEWIRTTLNLVDARRAGEEPWTRLAIILGSVALFTGCSAFLFCCRSLKERYHLK